MTCKPIFISSLVYFETNKRKVETYFVLAWLKNHYRPGAAPSPNQTYSDNYAIKIELILQICKANFLCFLLFY